MKNYVIFIPILLFFYSAHATKQNKRKREYDDKVTGMLECIRWKLCGKPIHCAAQHGFIHVVEHLLKHGVSLDDCNEGLYLAARDGNVEIVKKFLEHKAQVNYQKYRSLKTPLHGAVSFGHTEVVGILLEHGADVNARTDEAETPLHELWSNNTEILKKLLAKNATVDARDDCGRTPLELFARRNWSEGIEILLTHGANIHSQSDNGWTALHAAAAFTSTENALIKLLEQGAPINARASTTEAETPLHVAARFGILEATKILLAHGADKDARTNDGKKASDLARGEVKILLLAAGA